MIDDDELPQPRRPRRRDPARRGVTAAPPVGCKLFASCLAPDDACIATTIAPKPKRGPATMSENGGAIGLRDRICRMPGEDQRWRVLLFRLSLSSLYPPERFKSVEPVWKPIEQHARPFCGLGLVTSMIDFCRLALGCCLFLHALRPGPRARHSRWPAVA
jgi:hypothetical protein